MDSNNWSNFYTPLPVAKKMINLIPEIPDPVIIADICVGSGNLLKIAHERWPNSILLAIDLDIKAIDNFKLQFKESIVMNYDTLDFKKMSIFLENFKKTYDYCDLIVGNPPFGFYKNFAQNFQIFEQNHLLHILFDEANNLKRIEAFMFISNILFLKPNGIFASIIPENFFSSERWKTYRKIFIKYFFETLYLSKKDRFFSRSDVKSRIYIGRLKIKNIDNIHSKSIYKNIFLESKKNFKSYPNVEIIRGTFVSPLSKLNTEKNSIPIFHSDCMKFLRKKTKGFTKRFIFKEFINSKAILQKGDVVVTRVGRSCGESAAINKYFKGWHISDCIYIIRGIDIPLKEFVQIFNQNNYLKKRGLTIQYITKKDLSKVVRKIITTFNYRKNKF